MNAASMFLDVTNLPMMSEIGFSQEQRIMNDWLPQSHIQNAVRQLNHVGLPYG